MINRFSKKPLVGDRVRWTNLAWEQAGVEEGFEGVVQKSDTNSLVVLWDRLETAVVHPTWHWREMIVIGG